MRVDSFYELIVSMIKKIPSGKVATYGQIAALAGNPRGARQVVRALHASSQRDGLPWHRVINAKGQISLQEGRGYEIQKKLLESEGIFFDEQDKINLKVYMWKGN